MFQVVQSDDIFLQDMLNAFKHGSMIAASLEPDPSVFEAKTGSGLVRGHAYSVIKHQDLLLIRKLVNRMKGNKSKIVKNQI